MMGKLTITAVLSFLPALVSLCVFMTSPVAAKDETPTSKGDCIALSQALYRKAESLSKRTKQIIPREFARVAANLDEFCGEENFEKARISIDWINTCLKNFTKDYKLGFCSRNKNYFCAVFPQSEGCLQSQ
jgi:hypothetical protein